MGLAQRRSRATWFDREPCGDRVSGYDDDSLVEVPVGLVDDDDDGPLSGPWCVERKDGIACMTTLQVFTGLATGDLVPDTRVWRDGYGNWIAIAESRDLTDVDLEELIPEQSEIRLRRPRSVKLQRPSMTPWRLFGALGGLVVGALVAWHVMPGLTAEPPPHRLDSLGPTVAARGQAHLQTALEVAWQNERAWWRQRWPDRN